MKVLFSREAETELFRVVDHYADQRDGLGDEFVDAVDEMAREIGAWPLAGRPLITSLVHQNRG